MPCCKIAFFDQSTCTLQLSPRNQTTCTDQTTCTNRVTCIVLQAETLLKLKVHVLVKIYAKYMYFQHIVTFRGTCMIARQST